MKRILRNISLLLLVTIMLGGCSKFDEINTDPTAANEEQVRVEYFINQSIVKDQQNPGVSERAFILYWTAAGRFVTDADGGTFSHGSYNDQWSGAYYNNIASAITSINTAITLGSQKIEDGSAKDYISNMVQVARIWRAFLMSEMSDSFGPIPIKASEGENPSYSSVKEVYHYLLEELKEASDKIDLNVSITDDNIKSKDIVYGFNFNKWQRYANSLRMRLAMRLSEVEPSYAQQNFEDAAKEPYLDDVSQIFSVEQSTGWDDATGIYSRSWYTLPLTATLNNLTVNLGGIKTADQLNNSDIVPASDLSDALANIKSNDYVGLKDFNHFPTHTDNPTAGYWYNGLHETIDPRMYVLYYIPGNTKSGSFPSAGSVSENTKGYLYDIVNDDSNKKVDSINARFSWNALQDGDSRKTTFNNLINPSTNGFVPSLAERFRTSTEKRILFAPWESYFLIAEAKVRGWIVDGISAKDAYEDGIKASFNFWGLSQYVTDYLQSTDYNNDGTSVKWEHTTEPPADRTMNYTDRKTGASGTAQISYPTNELYENGTVSNDHLTKIITQKFIAQTPWLPRETWSDHRRLGLPFFDNVVVGPDGSGLPNLPGLKSDYMTSSQKYLPQRIKYPSSLNSNNSEGYNQAVGFLDGEDAVLTPLWWAQGAQ